jgi:hypothetical protein
MKISIDTPERLIAFVEVVDLPIDELNKIIGHCLGAIFTQEHPIHERVELLREYFEKHPHQNEKPIFIDVGDLSVLE